MKKLVIVGCGRLGGIVVDALQKGLLSEYELVGVYSRTASKAEALAARVQGCQVCGSVDNVLMTVCSYIPFTSPMAMFTRIAMSTVPWYEIAISIGILLASTFGIGILSAKIYRVGVLMYGTSPKIGNIIKAVWKA